MSEYTPSTEEIREQYSESFNDGVDIPIWRAQFDRALAEHDRALSERVWDDGFTKGFYDPIAGGDRDASESIYANPFEKDS